MADQVLSVLGFLSNTLSTFVTEEEQLLGGLRQEVQRISDEFGQMEVFLRKVNSCNDDLQLAEFTRQVREAAYDTEDVLAEFKLLFAAQRQRGCFGCVRSTFISLKNLPARRRLATKLQNIKDRIHNIFELRGKYVLEDSEPDKIPTRVSGFLPATSNWRDNKDEEALNAKEDQLVGIEKPKQQLLSLILHGDSQPKVVAVLGMGGVGKTTLVKIVHSDVAVENRFRIRVWVTVSQTYVLKDLLKRLIGKLHACFKESVPSRVDSMNDDELKAHIKDLLQRERYAIVFDDVWYRDFLDEFRFVLPESYGGNCVILTTRMTDVASSCKIGFNGHVLRKKYLTFPQSMTLFCRKTFKDNCYPPHLKDVVKDIVKKCEGLPLAIVAIGAVLAMKDSNRIDEWERIRGRLGYESEGAGKLDAAKKVLSLSYDDLSSELKTCLLYTSIFPADYEIGCLIIIGLWIAERVVAGERGPGIEEVGWNNIKELANRSLIQVGEISYDGFPETFQVHDLLREVIVSESRKINLMTVIGTKRTTIIWPPAETVIRRLVFHGNDSFHNFVAQQSHQYFNRLQSIVTFHCTEPPPKVLLSELLSSKFLKVVNFAGMQLEEIPEEIFNLFHLTHLNLKDSKVKIVPKTIKRLTNLEFLYLAETPVRELPEEILKLRKLRHLHSYQSSDSDMGRYGFKAPRNMESLLALEYLDCIDAAESDKTRIITEIGKLTQLKRLYITNLRREDGKELCSSLERLVNLQELSVASSNEKKKVIILDLNHHISNSSVLQSICYLDLAGRLENMPPWIPDLQNLGLINLTGSSLMDDPLESLRCLPNLIQVHLNQVYEGESLCFKSGGFQKLRKLLLKNMDGLRRMRVEEGAMPHIEILVLSKLPLVEEVPSGVEHLKEIQALWLWGMSAELTNKLKEGSEDYNKRRIGHIPKVYIDGRRIGKE